jgi:hypothetical protein
MMNRPLNDADLIELSDLAWELVDPEGEHDSEEHAWAALLPVGWPPIATLEELCARLEELVETLVPPSPAAPLRAVAAVMAFLAAQPERRPGDEDVISAALREAFPGGVLPADVAAWVDERRRVPSMRRRAHGAPHPRRHVHSRPSVREEQEAR